MNKSNTNLVYSGKVNFKLKIKDRIVNIVDHNTGTFYLFQSLINYLGGNTGELDFPEYIDVVEKEDGKDFNPTDDSTYKSMLKSKVPIVLVIPDVIPTVGKIEYQFNVQYNKFLDASKLGSSASETEKYYVCLLGSLSDENNNRNILAYIDGVSILQNIQPGTQAICSWILTLENAVNNETNS